MEYNNPVFHVTIIPEDCDVEDDVEIKIKEEPLSSDTWCQVRERITPQSR